MLGSPHSPAGQQISTGSPHWNLELSSAQQQFQRFTVVSTARVNPAFKGRLHEQAKSADFSFSTDVNRVTRLGEFSPIGSLFTFVG
jgi:hypothetical protein